MINLDLAVNPVSPTLKDSYWHSKENACLRYSVLLYCKAEPERIYNPNPKGVFRQCLIFSGTTLRGKHCRHPIAVMGDVDTFGQAWVG